MREFKFRAWESGEMYYQVRCGGMFDGVSTAPTVWNEKHGDWLNLTGQPHTVIMQYTGLDINKQEIYEGDIIKFFHEDNNEDTAEIAPVLWFGDSDWNCPAFDLDGRYIKEHYFEGNALSEILSSGTHHCEIVGNIYEYPELLESK